MNRVIRTASILLAVAVALCVTGAANADQEMHGRVSFTDQSALVKGTDDADWSYAGVNSLIMPGDSVWADDESALEIEFSGGTFLRLADGSKLEVVEVSPSALFRGTTGSFYVHRIRRSNGEATFDTPVGAIDIAPDTQVRVDILEEGETTVTVRWGEATIHAEGGKPVTLHTGERSLIDPGYLPSEPVVFDRTGEDAFDTWNRSRARQIAEGNTPTPIQSSYSGSGGSAPVGLSDLNGNGEWVYIDNTPYWRPNVSGYVPYRDGTWSYVPAQGYVWVDSYPWAYCTTHYGYWNYAPRYGWCWSYSGYYRPAYAYTVHYGNMFVWAPINSYGYPVCYDSYAGFTLGGVGFSYGFSSCAYDYYVYGGYCNVFGASFNYIYDHDHHYHYNNCDYWRIDSDKSPYKNSGQPHWPGDRQLAFAPERVYRGATVGRDGTTHARERAQTLEARQPNARTNGGSVVRTARTPQSTPTNPGTRQATRDVRLSNPNPTRVARGTDTTHPENAPSRSRTYTNDQARGASPLSHGSLADGSTVPANRTRPEAPSRGSVTNQPQTRTTGRTHTIDNQAGVNRTPAERPTVTRPSTRPTDVSATLNNFPTERPQPTTTRRNVERPINNQVPQGTVQNNPSERPRATTSRPQIAESPRPEVVRPSAPNRSYEQQPIQRQQYTPRAEQSRPQYTPRSEPQRPTYDQSVGRSQPQQPSYSPPPQASRPAPQYSPPPSAPSRGDSGSSAPSRSYSAPSGGGFSGGGGGGGGGGFSAPSRSGGGGGPSRSR